MVAEDNGGRKKPRIRKSAPTVRERVEASADQDIKTSGRLRRASKKAASPIKKLRLRDRKVVKLLAKVLRPIGRALRWLVPKYFVNSWRELKLVVWPSRRETWRLTLAVFIFALIFGALVAGVDKALDEIFKKVVLK
jgi:preprotein translocase SecE subunit